MTREEAIEIIKRNCINGSLMQEACEILLPELTENEDERIRKYLIDVVNDYCKGSEYEGCIAYLERQKEQKPISAVEVFARAGLKPYKDGNQWCILAGDNIQEGICGFGDTVDEALYQFLKGVLIMANSPQLKEQKPAEWSEEDEKMLKHVIDGIESLKEQVYCKSLCDEEIAWLKSLKPQPHWKPSEEQMEVFFKANPVNLMPEELAIYNLLYNDLKKLM